MSEHDEITVWLNQLVGGDSGAASELWRTYWQQLIVLARTRLSSSPRRVADEEDVVLSAFNSFCNAAQAGCFPDIRDRYDLWKLLVTITTRKAVAQLRREHAQKRGECHVRGESVFDIRVDNTAMPGLDNFLHEQPSPAVAAIAAEQVEHLLSQLDGDYRQTALLKCEGYSLKEIADKMNCASATVRRRLRRIQTQWSELLNP